MRIQDLETPTLVVQPSKIAWIAQLAKQRNQEKLR